jgi:hypothetical protein
VEFVAGPSEPVTPGAGAHATVRLANPGRSQSELVAGIEFDVLEGPRLIGYGHVTSK